MGCVKRGTPCLEWELETNDTQPLLTYGLGVNHPWVSIFRFFLFLVSTIFFSWLVFNLWFRLFEIPKPSHFQDVQIRHRSDQGGRCRQNPTVPTNLNRHQIAPRLKKNYSTLVFLPTPLVWETFPFVKSPIARTKLKIITDKLTGDHFGQAGRLGQDSWVRLQLPEDVFRKLQ